MNVTNDNISPVKCPTVTPNPISISENSLICATVNPENNAFLLEYPCAPININTINGFPISTNIDSIIIGHMNCVMFENTIWLPSHTKNSNMKKSLSGFSFELISYFSGDIDKATPASSAPASIEKFSFSNIVATMKHHAIAKNNKNSCDFAIFSVINGNISFAIMNTPTKIVISFIIISIITINDKPAVPVEDDINISINIATMSCTIRNPIAILPYNVSTSPLSDNSFSIIIVLLNVSAIAMYIAGIVANPKVFIIKNPITDVNIICPIPVISAIFPTSFTAFGFRCNPTMNSSIATPMCANASNVSFPGFTKFNNNGLTSIPVAICPIISGCLSIRIIPDTITAITRTNDNSTNTLFNNFFSSFLLLFFLVIY